MRSAEGSSVHPYSTLTGSLNPLAAVVYAYCVHRHAAVKLRAPPDCRTRSSSLLWLSRQTIWLAAIIMNSVMPGAHLCCIIL